MKDFFVCRTARGLIIPLLFVICVLSGGAGPAFAAKNAPVEVGFVGVPPPNFQNVLLNVQAVRINPNADAGPDSGKWETIPTPPGIGGSSANAELQIDLNTSQDVPQLFNTANVQPNTYKVAELLLDPNSPGTLIQSCPQSPPVGATNDGCITYPIQLAAGQVISVSNTGAGGLIAPSSGTLSQMILRVTMKVTKAPMQAGAPYTVSVTITPDTDPVLGTVTGTVTVSGAGTGSGTTAVKIRKLAVTAEAIGTNTAIATAQVKNGMYTLKLPAAGPPGTPFGSLYDLAVAGGGDSYAAKRLPPLPPSTTFPPVDFTVAGNQTLGNIAGNVTDNCVAGKPVVGATLQLLIPPDTVLDQMPPIATNFCITSPEQCIAVATANTDNAGNFPMPGMITTPSQFENVPKLGKNSPYVYVMEITAPGYDPLLVETIPNSGAGKKGGGSCTTGPTGTTFGPCDLALNTGYITGTIPITPPNPGQSILVQVLAEDHGTNTIESALPMPIVVSSSNPGTAAFTLNVPPSKGPFDLFSTTIDQYQGATDPYPGHTIAVLSDVTGPAEPSTTLPRVCSTVPAAFAQEIKCVGHGRITGTVNNANLGTSVVLSKEDTAAMSGVQITTTEVQNQLGNSGNTNPTNTYGFCAPADTYQLQTVQIPMASPSETPLVAPTPEPTGTPSVTVTIPPPPLFNAPSPTPSATPTGSPTPTATTSGPTPTSTPTPNVKCPTNCTNSDGSCPGLCNTVSGVNL